MQRPTAGTGRAGQRLRRAVRSERHGARGIVHRRRRAVLVCVPGRRWHLRAPMRAASDVRLDQRLPERLALLHVRSRRRVVLPGLHVGRRLQLGELRHGWIVCRCSTYARWWHGVWRRSDRAVRREARTEGEEPIPSREPAPQMSVPSWPWARVEPLAARARWEPISTASGFPEKIAGPAHHDREDPQGSRA